MSRKDGQAELTWRTVIYTQN